MSGEMKWDYLVVRALSAINVAVFYSGVNSSCGLSLLVLFQPQTVFTGNVGFPLALAKNWHSIWFVVIKFDAWFQ